MLGLQAPRYANRVAEVQKRNAEALANLQMLRERMERRETGLQVRRARCTAG